MRHLPCILACPSPPTHPRPAVIANLEHRHSYVRKNAVLALSAIFRLPKGELLVPDAPELVERLLQQEQDLSTRRNAFLMLAEHAQDRAVAYLFQQIDRVADWGDILQVAVLDLIRKARAGVRCSAGWGGAVCGAVRAGAAL